MKKSLSQKLNKFRTSPLIIGVAVLEVIVLLCMCTYAWFIFAENNTVSTDVISVEPDSGLEIDFNEANENDYINIWNYLNEFQFEPVTSLDGRNIFIPTTGTFNSTNTANMTFREGTVNDMNSKYINIDFTLTNTGVEDMPVYLSSKSFFKLYDPQTGSEVNSKAIRIAFYQNDGSSGKVTSSLLSQEYDGNVPEDPEDPDGGGTQGGTYIVYLDAPSNWTDASQIRAYVFGDSGNPVGFPGEVMKYDSSTGYYYYTADRKYNKVIFNYQGNQNQTVDLDVYDKGVYVLDEGRNGTWALDHIKIDGGTKVEGEGSGGNNSGSDGTGESYGQTTVYFNNTLGWAQPYAYIWRENGDSDEPLSSWPGKPMTHISGSIYYYTFSSKYDSIIFNDGNSQGGAIKTGDIHPVKDGHIYMIGAPTGDNEFGWTQEDYMGTVEGGTYPVISPGVSTGFQRPYAPVTQIDDNSGSSKVVVPAFASSIDDYNNGSENPLFTIKAGQTLPLSMIIWLEGTDPDCTEDVYAGKYIDMNLVFATPLSQGEEMYTYQFLDKTKENWIDDKVTTDTGVSFKPVIQLYDAENHKGYMMQVHDDENGNPTIWQCKAPVDLINSDHIIFRRVNPMKEDEVWNYWDTDGFSGISEAVVDSTVYFTAFSDGAPTTAKYENGNTYDGAPSKSCGGLWGNHETQIVTLYDGTSGQWLKNSDKEGTTSVMTMSYLYRYSNGKTQTVEYKASGSGDRAMYYFIVPFDVYSRVGTNHLPENGITFKRYYNFNEKFAANSNLNQLTYHMSWNAGLCNGKFYEITENDGTKWGYWGSDMLYIQAKSAVTSKMDNAWMQVRFYANNSSTTSTNDFITYLYKNNYYNSSGNGYGYACVVPSDRNYYKYRVERCNPNNHSEVWNTTPLQTVVASTSTNNFYSNTIDKNICSIENMQITIFLQLSTNYCGYGSDPYYYIWNNSTKAEGAGAYPGTVMTYHDGITGYSRYKCTVNISQYDRIIFSNSSKGYKTGDLTIGTDSDYNGMIFEGNSSTGANKLSTVMSGFDKTESLNVVLYDAPDWDKNGS